MRPDATIHLHEFVVRSNEAVARDIWRLVIEAPELAREIAPGQFMNFAVPGDNSHLVRIPLSFAQAIPDEGTIEVVYAVVGEGTRRLSQMRPGQASTVVGPCGHGWQISKGGRVLAVAGGVGAPPILAATRAFRGLDRSVDLILGARTAELLWGEQEAQMLGAEVFVMTDDGSYGGHGFTTDCMTKLLSSRRYDLVVTCGPQPMMSGVARVAAEAGLACQASLERMMTCGFGACNTCNVAMRFGGYRLCCSDGPVFDAAEVAW